MATLPFRRPQFSDDVAWLPPWLQPNHSSSPTTSLRHGSDDVLPQYLQNVDLFKGDDNHVRDSNPLLTGETRYNICHLYLSGEDSSRITLTPSEKVLHFNLHLSTDGTSSINSTRAWDSSPNDKLNSSEDEALYPVKTLHTQRKGSRSKLDNNASDISRCPPSNENCSGKPCDKTPCDSGHDNSEVYNKKGQKGPDCEDISDAVELSVAASEALVIHEIFQSETNPETVSSAAVLEVALRVKHARVDGLQNSICCSNYTEDTSDILSDLSDSELEDAYNDVGLSISSLDNISSLDPSVSRVKDTPLSHIHLEDEREVQSELNQDQEIRFKNSCAVRPLESSLDKDTSKDLVNVTLDIKKHEKSFDSIPETECCRGNGTKSLQMNKGKKNDKADVQDSANKKRKSSLQLLHSGNASMNREIGGASSGYQSRWLGGWTAKEGDVCGGKESKVAKTVRKLLINEASYLSESTYIASEQNSVNYHQSCSKYSEAIKSFEGSCKKATTEVYVSQDVIRGSNSSSIDPLCSMVPCSLTSACSMATKDNDDPKVIGVVKSIELGTEIPLETVQASSSQNKESIGRKEHSDLLFCGVDVNPIIQQQTKSLKVYSRKSARNSPPSWRGSFYYGLVEEEGNEVLGYGFEKITCNNSNDPTDLIQSLCVEAVEPMPDCASGKVIEQHEDTRLLAVEQHISSHSNSPNEKIPNKPQHFRSMVSCTSPANSEENNVGNSVGRPVEDHCEGSDRNGEVHITKQDIRKSPLLLGHRTRRLKAPKLAVADLLTGCHTDEVCGTKNIIHRSKEVPKGQLGSLLNTEISAKKRVHFSDTDIKPRPNKRLKRSHASKLCSRVMNRLETVNEEQGITSQEVKERLTNCRRDGRKRSIFQGLDFLLTGFSKKKEQEIEGLLRKHGGMVLSDIPTPLRRARERASCRPNAERLPVIICSRKLQTTTFLYGGAVSAFLLKAGWAYDSIKAGSVLPPDKYEVLTVRAYRMFNKIGKSISQSDVNYIFVEVGIMLHGTHSFCTKLATVIKHGRGLVCKSMQWLVQSLDKKKISLGAIVVEDESHATRHLKKCASEQKISVMPASWIVNSLFEGKLLPVQENINSSHPPAIKVPAVSVLQEWSQEI